MMKWSAMNAALTRVNHLSTPGSTVILINTPLQRGEQAPCVMRNRFNGFNEVRKTVETVSDSISTLITPLKQGVNERTLSQTQKPFEISGMLGG